MQKASMTGITTDGDAAPHTPIEQAFAQISGGTAKKDHLKDCKPPIKYIVPELVDGCAYGMLAGELKYDAWNFLKGHDRQDLLGAAIRHLNADRMGERVDADCTARLEAKFGDKAPQVKHLWLALCNINMILWQELYGTGRDSLPRNPHADAD